MSTPSSNGKTHVPRHEDSENFSPTHMRMLTLLSDGLVHTKEEMLKTIDEMADDQTLFSQIHLLRKKLERFGETVVGEYYKRTVRYRHVRLLANAYDGTT